MGAETEICLEKVGSGIMSMFKGAKTRVQFGGRHLEEFDVGVGVHQRSVLSSCLFPIVLDVLSENGKKVLYMFCFMQMTWSRWQRVWKY